MIFKQYPLNKLEVFFLEDFEEQSFLKVLVLLIFSFGLYFLSWIYNINRKLELIDDDAPDSNRAFFILFLFPVGWSLIYLVLTRLIFSFNIYMFWSNIIMSGAIIYLSLNYLYQFSISFGKLTRTSGLMWYILLYTGYLGVIPIFFNIYYLVFLVIISISSIAIMQEFLNITSRDTLEKSQREHFKNTERLA